MLKIVMKVVMKIAMKIIIKRKVKKHISKLNKSTFFIDLSNMNLSLSFSKCHY